MKFDQEDVSDISEIQYLYPLYPSSNTARNQIPESDQILH